MELKDFFTVIKRYLAIILMVVFIVTAATAAISISIPKKFQTSASLLIQPVREPTTQYQYGGYYAIQASELFASTVLGWLKSPEVMSQVYQEAQIEVSADKIEGLTKQIVARKIPPQNISINLTDTVQSRAIALTKATTEVIRKRTEEINKSAGEGSTFTIVTSDIITVPVKPNLPLNLILAMIIGLALGIITAFLKEYFSATINFSKTAGQIFETNNVVSFYGKIKGLIDQESAAAERFRFLRANILPLDEKKEKISLVVSGINEKDQTSKIAANLALSAARAGRRVILIDSDFEHPVLHELFAIPNIRGFSELLFDTGHVDSYLVPTPEANLKVVPAGMRLSYSADTIARADLEKLSNALYEKADLIIYNVAPLSDSSDAFPLFGVASKALLVIKLSFSHCAAAEYIHRFLSEKNIGQCVVVVN